MSGDCRGGELLGILGPSGSGKTTLMRALAHRLPASVAMAGTVLVDGTSLDVGANGCVAYVAQETALPATETPREAIEMAALLRLPATMRRRDKLRRAADMVETLRLGPCADTILGSDLLHGCSGGERRRCAVALELVTAPKLVFLDEPTSGLDSFAAYEVVDLLHTELAVRHGICVVCTIHQPSSEAFRLFDKAHFLRAGELAYAGRAGAPLRNFFERALDKPIPAESAVADYVLLVLQTCTDDEAKKLVRAAGDAVRSGLRDAARAPRPGAIAAAMRARTRGRAKTSTFVDEVRCLAGREARASWRNPARFVVGVCISAFMSLIVGIIFLDIGRGSNDDPSDITSHFGLLFIINAMMAISQPVILTFPLDRGILVRELAVDTFSLPAYIVSKLAIELPSTLVIVTCSVSIPWFLGALRSNLFELIGTTAVMAAAASSSAMFLSSLAPSPTVAMQLAPLVLVPQIMFAGFTIRISQIPPVLRWCHRICALTYGTNLALLNEFHHCHKPACDLLLHENEVDRDDKVVYLTVLLAIFATFRTLSLIALRLHAR
ncbi:P-loop containing nucleoside triphosphate hydrolase protein [Pelagophyceae sp. CCMP2097]|nr:P-loop containing nucleoside triphosphate hydrolase protein [Pelagophyceae sp. CCMP2097]